MRYHPLIMANYIFKKYLDDRSAEIDEHLRTYFHCGSHPDMDRYLYDPLAKYSENGGKRHRPLITLLACAAVGGDEKRAMAAGAAIEHFHTAALIHDDIADDSQLRRGEPCMHITMGEGLAINAGDLALSLVTGTVINDEGEKVSGGSRYAVSVGFGQSDARTEELTGKKCRKIILVTE